METRDPAQESLADERRPLSDTLHGDVAIIGMAGIFPQAANVDAYWRNIVTKVDAIIDAPQDRWDTDIYYDPHSREDNRIYTKRGGYLTTDHLFSPMEHGIMPVAVDGGETEHFLLLQLVKDALARAGYDKKAFNRERTETIIARGNYLSTGMAAMILRSMGTEIAVQILRTLSPDYTEEQLAAIRQTLRAGLPKFNPETAPSLISNVMTGRIANRLDLMGTNYTVDAACASSLIATETAMRDLLTGKCDLGIVGGAHTFTSVPFLMIFCAFDALSRSSQIKPFDKDADGVLSGEAIGLVLVKRLEDAERDGDTIYAVIKGVGVASDGRALSVVAPRQEGQELALRRAYEMAGFSPRTVELVEAHGTATLVGDATEMATLSAVFGPRDGETATTAVGTVKSMIGHAMPASGIAGIVKTVLALHHKVLPPTLHCDQPNPKFELEKSPFYINTETRPWIHGNPQYPRRAAVDAFGFGGINAHLVLEEYVPREGAEAARRASVARDLIPWETESCLLRAPSRDALIARAAEMVAYLQATPQARLADVAATLAAEPSTGPDESRLAIVASTPDDLRLKLERAISRLQDPACRQIKDVGGIYYFAEPLARTGKLAFLFPGEGSQYLNMLADLCLHFPEVRATYEQADADCLEQGRVDVPSHYIFPAPFFSQEERDAAEQRLWRMDRQSEAILTSNRAMLAVMKGLGITPDMMMGHSFGEWTALGASGILDIQQPPDVISKMYSISEEFSQRSDIPPAVVIAVGAGREVVGELAEQVGGGIHVALDNCPHQVVVAGEPQIAERFLALLQARNISFQRSKLTLGYHTPLFAEHCEAVRRLGHSIEGQAPSLPTYCCATAAPFPDDTEAIREIVVETWARPVEFRRTVEAMYDAGARLFVEVGPKGNLTAFVDDILREQPHLAMASNLQRRAGITQLNHLAAVLAAQGLPINLGYFFARRDTQAVEFTTVPVAAAPSKKPLMNISLRLPVLHMSQEQADEILGRNGKHPVETATKAPQGMAVAATTSSMPAPAAVQDVPAAAAAPHAQSALVATTSTAPAAPPAVPVISDVQRPVQSGGPTIIAPSVAADQGRAGGRPAISPPPAAVPAAGVARGALPAVPAAAQVMQDYMRTMERFLHVQQDVMSAYLSRATGVPAAPGPVEPVSLAPAPPAATPRAAAHGLAPAVPQAIATLPGTPAVADAGGVIPGSWRASEVGPAQDHGGNNHTAHHPAPDELDRLEHQAAPSVGHANGSGALPADAAGRSPGAGDASAAQQAAPVSDPAAGGGVEATLLALVAERTGYPPEMLDLDLNMEADLGIDSIKRVEVLAAYQAQHGLVAEGAMEKVSGLKTLREVIDFLSQGPAGDAQ